MGQALKDKNSISAKALKVFSRVVADDMAMLVSLHDKEPDAELLQALRKESFPDGVGLKLIAERGRRAFDLMEHALAALPERIDEAMLDELAADFANIYLNYGIHASPEESVWIDDENLTCQDSMFQVRAWYEEHGLMAENWRIRPDDHLVLQIRFLAHLFSNAQSTVDLKQAGRFMDEHLLRWLGSFSERVATRCSTAYFAGIALLTDAYCEELRDLLATILEEPRPSQEEIDERMKVVRKPEEVPVSFMPGMGPAV
ncbi:MAG: molecular chaperone TorD family protein [Candidatus Thiodiazotropha sp. (ex Epidulcina cf. delphinae)]|nr:molecular chaperone TorD family protein [Candidatus Thiodiazotropha sp. (ex Epidulcina cf. delphinae)]